MAVVAVLLAVLAVVPEAPALAIHRGEAADIAAYPFMVSLRLAGTPDSPRCGGTLVEPDIVLAAAPRVATLGHAVPETFDLSVDNRDDIALLRLATRQSTPTVALATAEPRVGGHVVTTGWGCTNAPPVCEAPSPPSAPPDGRSPAGCPLTPLSMPGRPPRYGRS
jgi:secreted trypsin-like serine protease